MTVRRLGTVAVLVLLLAGAAVATWRSTSRSPTADPVSALAADLRCPACQGESVADSRSPIAASMREAIAAQHAAGRSPDEIRAYFVERYGPEVLAVPPARGLGLLLWVVPALALLLGLAAMTRRLHRVVIVTRLSRWARHRSAVPPNRSSSPRHRSRPTVTGAGRIRRTDAVRLNRRIWTVGTLGLLGLIATIAVTAPSPTRRPVDPVVDAVTSQLALARSFEQQGRYGEAVEVYQAMLSQRPDDVVRLRMAFALLRSGRSADAEELAGQVLAAHPDAPEAVLMLGLAQRESGSPSAASTLRRFLALAPEHPATSEVRRLLGGG